MGGDRGTSQDLKLSSQDPNIEPKTESCAPLVVTTNVFAMLQYIPWAGEHFII